ncbi:hypothetical protein [Streptomyces jeddahensis]|uniref:Tox-REase-5 domain-containing protein n=1 Tax=Streptomyces jeddahensis TaxID=1716141 RepID=A0A177HUH3_9ACTN|nr:hypothetical protein [Streptomyces jeddahensis]OAH13788.1 hypothetical protein STSP_27660 [Streptomyces jeddahensis]
MSWTDDGGMASTPAVAGPARMPRALATALMLLVVLFVLSVLPALGVLLAAPVDGAVLGALLYAIAPGTAGMLLARRMWAGGPWTGRALVGVQVWLALEALGTMAQGSGRGLTQLLLPVTLIVLLTRPASRAWFRLPEPARENRPEFSLPRMLKWRHSDEGQSAAEYVGLVVVVAAIIIALLVSGVGPQIAGGFQAAVCKVTGTSCPADSGGRDGSSDVRAGDDGGATAGGGNGGSAAGGSATGGSGGSGGSGTSGGSGDSGSASGGTDDGNGSGSTGDTQSGDGDNAGDGGGGGGGGSDEQKDDGCFSGFGSFFGCAAKETGGFVKGVVVDGVGGDIVDAVDAVIHPIDTVTGTVTGLWNYGKDIVVSEVDGYVDKWRKGDYAGIVTQALTFNLRNTGRMIDDFIITDGVSDAWNRGDYGEAVGLTLWNGGSYFIPGYGEAKLGNLLLKLNKVNKVSKVVKAVEKAAEAAERARKAARAGDLKGAEKAADEAQKAADEAADTARKSGCVVAAPRARVPYGGGEYGREPAPAGPSGGIVSASYTTGVPGTASAPTTPAVHSANAPSVLQVEEKCDVAKQKDARDAQQQALEARAEAAKAALRERGSSVPDDQIDGLVNRAKDNPDPSKGEIGKKDAADALDDITDLSRRKNVDGDAAAALEGKVANASDANKLAEARAEVNAVRRAADDAAPGSQVDAGVGSKMNRKEADLGNGEKVNLDEIPDADVVYKDKNGIVHVKEVKNAGSATRKADFANQVERLKKWASKEPGRKATVEIETTDRWTQIFSEFKQARNGKPAKDTRTAAGEMARNGVDVKVAGQGLSADELGSMQRAIDERTKNGTMDWTKMKDPESAKAYLGIK